MEMQVLPAVRLLWIPTEAMQDMVEELSLERTAPRWIEAPAIWQDTLQRTLLQVVWLKNAKSNCPMQSELQNQLPLWLTPLEQVQTSPMTSLLRKSSGRTSA